MNFVDELSTWYLRLSRNRLRAEDNAEASHVFGYSLYTFSQLMAPFAPFFSEVMHHNLVDETTSIHHTDWPKVESDLLEAELESEMTLAQKIVSEARALRKQEKIKLRQPLANLKVKATQIKPQAELLQVIAQEINVKKITWQTEAGHEEPDLELDTQLTAKLEAEGEARELMRQIQKLRKKAQLRLDEIVTVQAPDWPKAFQEDIESHTKTKLVMGPELKILE